MNKQQAMAITNPCQFASQCTHPMYVHDKQIGDYLFRSLLTVNTGEE